MDLPALSARTWLLIGLLVPALGMAACGDDDDEAAEEPAGETTELELRIGDLVPLTGDLSDFGPPGRKAADLAVEQIRAAADEAGADHTVEITHEDTQTQPQAAVSAARKAVGGGATCLIGAWASADTIPVARSVAIREEVLQISPASTSDEITGLEDDGLVNRTAPPDSFQGPALADALEEDLGGADGKLVNIGARNDAYGTGLADTFTEAWEGKGGRIGQRVVYDPEQPSYNSEAREIVRGDADAFVIIDFPETYTKVGPALVRTGGWGAGATWVTDGLKSGNLPENAGEQATEGMRGTAPGVPDEADAADAFDRLYRQAGGPDRQTFDAQNFDAVILCYLSAVAAGSADATDMVDQLQAVSGPPGEKFTWEQLPQAIEALQNGDEIDYQGASGPIDLNEDGDPTAGVYDIFRYEGGAVENIDEVPLSKEAAQ
jgi:ABC-type branched-subunit amino acid transport system substrate-binding protein